MAETRYVPAKRLLDVALVLLMIPVWLPLLLGAAWAVWRQSGRPVLFAQERLGRGGRPFHMYKLTTMLPVGPRAVADEERLTHSDAGCARPASTSCPPSRPSSTRS